MSKKKQAKKLADKEHDQTGKIAGLRDTPVVKALSPISEAADQPPLLALGAGTLAVGAMLRNPALTRTGARMLASHLVATGLKTVLKAGVDRTRPSVAKERGHHVGKGSGSDDTDVNAFPSGHTAGAVAVAQAVAHEAPAAATPVRALAGTVAALQLPRGAHYISDVVAGAAVGWIGERIAGIAARAIEKLAEDRTVRQAEEEAEAHPS